MTVVRVGLLIVMAFPEFLTVGVCLPALLPSRTEQITQTSKIQEI